MTINKLLNERRQVHGKFADTAMTAVALKRVANAGVNYNRLTYEQRESLDMILHKIARIVNGNPCHSDHWVDIAGYATLVLRSEISVTE